MRIGWATPTYPAGTPLGTDTHSYAFDGFLVCVLLQLFTLSVFNYLLCFFASFHTPHTYVCSQACKWHGGSDSFGQRWKAGDVVGCLLDIDEHTICKMLHVVRDSSVP